MKSFIKYTFISILGCISLLSAEPNFELENKYGSDIYLSIGTPKYSPHNNVFFKVTKDEIYSDTVDPDLGSWILISKEVPISGKTKVLSVTFLKPWKKVLVNLTEDFKVTPKTKLKFPISGNVKANQISMAPDQLYKKTMITIREPGVMIPWYELVSSLSKYYVDANTKDPERLLGFETGEILKEPNLEAALTKLLNRLNEIDKNWSPSIKVSETKNSKPGLFIENKSVTEDEAAEVFRRAFYPAAKLLFDRLTTKYNEIKSKDFKISTLWGDTKTLVEKFLKYTNPGAYRK